MPTPRTARKATAASTSRSKTAVKMPARTSPRASTAKTKDIIELLVADHKKVKKLFKDFEKIAEKDPAAKVEIARQICMELTIHAQIEEEIFYPVAHEHIKDADLIDEATVEHATAKDLIKQIQSMKGSEELYDAKVKVLGEYINHHVEEEEGEIFPQAKRAKLDLETLGIQMQQRKEQLMPALYKSHH
jgi:hemerythrin superfamily protein